VGRANSTRRTLIHGLVVVLSGGQAGTAARLGHRARRLVAALGAGRAEAAPAALPTSDIQDLLAFAEALVRADALPPVEQGYLREHFQRQLRADGEYYGRLYRTTARLLTQLAGQRFATLDPSERRALVARHRLGVSAVAPDESLGPSARELRDVRTRAAPDLIGGYYASPAGWAVVRYTTFPGRCGDLARYTRPEP
jgi:hypothetical protein